MTNYTLEKAIEMFGKDSKNVTMAEMKQLHDKNIFTALREEIMDEVKKKALRSLIFLKQKRCGRLKERAGYRCSRGKRRCSHGYP